MTDGNWGFQVVRADLGDLGIDAGQSMGMVIVQPEYELVPDAAVPFRIADACRQAQKALIEQAFQIRAVESHERNVPLPFVLFPEAAIPVRDPDGLDCLRQQIEKVEGDVIFIGGLEGLSPQEAHEVADRFPSCVGAARPSFAAGQFVNICVIAVKSANGRLSWHFQAKLRPSKWEQPRNMALGRRVLYFIAPHVAFLCQICFDHIAADGEQHLNTSVCRQVIATTQPSAASLDFVFVPECNPDPDHPSMRQNTGILLKHQDRALMNAMTAIVVVNRAASAQEPKKYGRSGLHYKAGRWQPPTSDIGPKGYELCDSDHVTSAVFRRRAHAIHVATLVPPSHNIGNSGNPRLPLDNPRSYLIRDECEPAPCSCLPGRPGTAGKFVECDCLPCKLCDALLADLPAKDEKRRWQGHDPGQSELLARQYGEIRKGLLKLASVRARELVYLLLEMHGHERNNPDLWSDLQSEAVVELLSALSVLAELRPVSLVTAPQWTAWLGESLAVALLDGANKKYSCDEMELKYLKMFEAEYYRPEARRIPVLLVALRSRGLVQPLVKPSSADITKPTDPNRLGDQNSFTNATLPRFYVCQDALFDGAREAKSIAEFLKSEMRWVLA